jgi:hypothetical protein
MMGAHDFDTHTGDLFAASGGTRADYLMDSLNLSDVAVWVLIRSLKTLRHPGPGGRLTRSAAEALEWVFCSPAPGASGITFDFCARAAGVDPGALRDGAAAVVGKIYGSRLAAVCRQGG